MTRHIATEQPKITVKQPTRSQQPRLSAGELRDAIEVLPSKSEGKHSITIQVRATGAFFRITPARDPKQPRVWCVSVRQCSSGGILEESGVAWIDRPGSSQTQLAETIEVIRNDIGTWLSVPERQTLCNWLLTAAPVPTPAQAAGLSEQPATPRP